MSKSYHALLCTVLVVDFALAIYMPPD